MTLDLARFLLFGIGTLFVLAAAYIGNEQRGFRQQALVAEGTVVDLRAVKSARGSLGDSHRRVSLFIPVIEFRLVDGRAQRFESSSRQSPPRFALQQKVRVLYLPADPARARLDGFMDRWLLLLIFGGIGLVLLLIGFGISMAEKSS